MFRVRIGTEARRQILEVAAWWKRNREAAPGLFRSELAAALDLLRWSPELGASYPESPVPRVRRLLMVRTRYHLYYTVHPDGDEVFVRAIWHASRGEGPPLG